MATPYEAHINAMKHIFKYVKGIAYFGILYLKRSCNLLEGHIDVDWGRRQFDNQCSTVGYVFKMGISVVTWFLKKQPIVALSSMKSKYCALTKGAK
jgi:hypothetical protein